MRTRVPQEIVLIQKIIDFSVDDAHNMMLYSIASLLFISRYLNKKQIYKFKKRIRELLNLRWIRIHWDFIQIRHDRRNNT